MKFVFFGSSRFSVIVLECLMREGFVPAMAVTVPDDVAGRGKALTPPPIKAMCVKAGIPVMQPPSLKDSDVQAQIQQTRADFGVVAAYRKIIPQQLIDAFPRGILNVHPSLLPQWRGPSPVEAAIMHGETATGVSIMLLDAEMDHGPILKQARTEIGPDEYAPELHARLAHTGGELLVETIPLWLTGAVIPMLQDHARATFSKMLSWQDGRIDCAKPVQDVYSQIRALSREPGTWVELPQRSKFKGQDILKILKASPMTSHPSVGSAPGLREMDRQLVLACRDGSLFLEQVQPQGKRAMSGKEFLNGYRALLTE